MMKVLLGALTAVGVMLLLKQRAEAAEGPIEPPPRHGFDPLVDPVMSSTDAAKVVALYAGYDPMRVKQSTVCAQSFPPVCYSYWIARQGGVGEDGIVREVSGGNELVMSIDEKRLPQEGFGGYPGDIPPTSAPIYVVLAKEYSLGTQERYNVSSALYEVAKGHVNFVSVSRHSSWTTLKEDSYGRW